ncbi:F-box/LRR-repeat protein At3g59190 [Brachypodium distachyon]|uniref:F-box/LRR-repeat protein At3g59190 n=1 Tax=Brachypodium distachyon TaxID=15368 RepID=UPI00052FF08A|nr:F-box/LRR-repeat protein At3g59190 [Brachypodium distachyon]|eukprot:XP_010233348.1 F-box/LRR-repeat protein At3g59190 [Brachypodium distachyon]
MAIVPAAKRRGSGGASQRRPRKWAPEDTCDGEDLISDLPDAILATIVSLLPTNDGAHTQILARRWRPLWHAAPLNLDSLNLRRRTFSTKRYLGLNQFKTFSVVSRILADHPGPVRRFRYDVIICLHKDKKRYAVEAAQIESWFHSLAIANLQELDITFRPLEYTAEYPKLYPLPSSVFLTASTLLLARIGLCDFPKDLTQPLNFPLLKQLHLWRISISEDVFQGVLSGCHVLETLFLAEIRDVDCLRVSSPTLRIIVTLAACSCGEMELVIEDTPCLEKLLIPWPDLGREIIRVVHAPKLEILGHLSPSISEIQIASIVFQVAASGSLLH